MVKDKGLNCKYIICARPKNAPVTERAVPVAIFSAEESVKRHFLRKWLKEDPTDMDPRSLLDWDYYLERLGSVIQKLITIPAALQKVRNPVPRVAHPDWLQRRINIKDDKMKQKKMTDLFTKAPLDDFTNIRDPRLGDLEDLGTKLLKPKALESGIVASQRAQKRKVPEPDVPVSVNPYASLPEKMPSPTEDYEGFLEYQKLKWKIQKQARIRRRHLFGETRVTVPNHIGAAFQNQAEQLFKSTWQVLQLRSTPTPGILTAHVLIESKIHTLKVKVPRQVFLNLKGRELPDVEIEDCEVEKVNHTLPNGHPSVHLFKLTMPEEVYVNDAQKLSILFNHPSVEGVYEKQVPLDVRAVLQLGSLCTFDETQPGVLGKGLEQGFDLSGLRRAVSNQPYLAQSPLAYLYLYHVVAGDRQVFALFSTASDQAHIVILQKSKDNGQELPNVSKIYTDLLARRDQEANGEPWQMCFEYQERVQFSTKQVTTRRKALLEVGDLLKKMRKDETVPLMLIIQSPQRRMLAHDIPILSEFPVLPLKYEVSDSTLPPLGWQTFIAKRLVNHYLSLGSWILHLTELARYGDVPLCNLERDDPRFLIDVAYARRLQKNNVVLWWSGGPRPDHAGYERDDILGPLETVQMPLVNNPGTYSSVCIELDVRNLAINTILTSSLINELEGSDSISFNPAAPMDDVPSDGTNVLYSDNAFATAGVTVLREMVKAWWTEACKGSSMADIMVQHLVRWVESPDSFLYDRSLHYYVQMMSRKAFQQLMSDFRRVGSHVVFANANRLLLQTTKAEVGNAYAYSQYILKSIKAKPLFHFLDLEIKEYWDYLVWYDEFNYGGKACQEVVEAENQKLECIMHWQLSKFLPATLQPIFNDWVIEFIEIMQALKRPRVLTADGTTDSTPRPTQIPVRALGDDKEDKIVLGKTFEKPLKRQIAGLISRQKNEMLHPELASDYSFPVLPGSHLNLSNPVLQLVKSLMQVLSLDKNITMEARLLRKELLALFDVREFSAQATFNNPSESLKFQQLICDNCTMARDLDLCRDEDLIPDLADTMAAERPWLCNFCGAEYDKLGIEQRMIADVEAVIVEWQCQDLKCGKCKGVRINDFMEHCSCGADWVGSVSRAEVERKIKVWRQVANFYGLRMLRDVVEGVLASL
jgi:DNA polymerase epsilon subunit 1